MTYKLTVTFYVEDQGAALELIRQLGSTNATVGSVVLVPEPGPQDSARVKRVRGTVELPETYTEVSVPRDLYLGWGPEESRPKPNLSGTLAMYPTCLECKRPLKGPRDWVYCEACDPASGPGGAGNG